MELFDWQQKLRTLLFFFRIVGLWPQNQELYTFNLYTLYTATSFFLFGFCHNFTQMVQVFLTPMSLQVLAGTLFIASQTMAALKAYVYIRHLKVIKQMLRKLEEDDFQPKTEKQRKMVTSDLESWWKIYVGYQIALFSTVVLWTSFPILDKSYKESRLPFAAWYPFDYKRSPFYEITYFYQSASLCFLNIYNSNLDMFSLSLMIYIGSQCDILCENLKKLGSKKKRNDNFQKQLIALIKHHKEILSFANDFNNFVDKILLSQFITSASSIALSLFQLTLIAPFSSEFFSVISYIVSVTFQIFLYCWYGNEIEVRSGRIMYAIFGSEWIGVSPETQKTLRIFILRAQRQITITTFRLFPLSLTTFMAIMRSAWSYFAVLRQVNAPQN